MQLIVAMVGENVHGRVLSNALTNNGIKHTCLIEKETKNSLIREQWLDPNYGGDIQAPKVFCNDIFGQNEKKILSELNGYAINGGLPIIKKEILSLPSMGFLNVHPGILPNYRGLDPVKWSIRNLDPLGATVHLIDEGIDTGPILLKKEMKQFKSRTIKELRLEILEFSSNLLVEYILNRNEYQPEKQCIEDGAKYSSYLGGDEEKAEKRLQPLLKYYPLSAE